MVITIDAKDFQAEDNMAVAQLLYAVGSKFENKDDSENPIASYTESDHVPIDDWNLFVKVTINLED